MVGESFAHAALSGSKFFKPPALPVVTDFQSGKLPTGNSPVASSSNDYLDGNMRKLICIIEKIVDVLSGELPAWTIFVLMVMVLCEVVARYMLNAPLSIADEYGGYMLVMITFVGLGYTWKERGHVSVEFVTNNLPPRIKIWVRLVTLILATVFCWPLLASSYDLIQSSLLFNSKSESWLRTPLVYPQSMLLVGSVLLFLQLVVEIIKEILALTIPKER